MKTVRFLIDVAKRVWWKWDIQIVVVLVIAAICSLLYMAAASTIEDQKRWSLFVEEYNCKIVGKTKGTHSMGSGVNPATGKVGMVNIYTPGQTGYSCDDGATYWR